MPTKIVARVWLTQCHRTLAGIKRRKMAPPGMMMMNATERTAAWMMTGQLLSDICWPSCEAPLLVVKDENEVDRRVVPSVPPVALVMFISKLPASVRNGKLTVDFLDYLPYTECRSRFAESELLCSFTRLPELGPSP